MFIKPSLIAAGFAVGLAALVPGKAEAHRAWLLPSMTVLSGESETVTVDAAISNELFVFEHRAMGLDNLIITGPDGEPVEPVIIGSGEYRSVFDVGLKTQGTYKIAIVNSGSMGSYELNGERRRMRGGADKAPEGATNIQVSEFNSRIETFVTLGAPTQASLQPTGKGLELVPVTHPNDFAAGEEAKVRFLLDGEPASGLEVEFVEGGTRYRDEAGSQVLTADADGVVALNAGEAGMYFIEASVGGGRDAGPSRRASYAAVLEFLPL